MFKRSMLILLLLGMAAAGGLMYGYSERDSAVKLSSGESLSAEVPAHEITVYVTGAVNRPGVVTLKEGARIGDAVNSCGGVLPTGDAERINMAQVLKDGQKIQVPEKAQAAKAAAADKSKSAKAGSPGEGALVNINTADLQALDALPGVGPSTAQKIIDYRETEGAFQDIADLKKIKGIGEAKFAKLKDKICI
jgi:competence protein ComEA